MGDIVKILTEYGFAGAMVAVILCVYIYTIKKIWVIYQDLKKDLEEARKDMVAIGECIREHNTDTVRIERKMDTEFNRLEDRLGHNTEKTNELLSKVVEQLIRLNVKMGNNSSS